MEMKPPIASEMRLYKLIGLEIEALMKEHEETLKNIARYEDILNNYDSMSEVIMEDLDALKKEYAVKRRTVIEHHFAVVYPLSEFCRIRRDDSEELRFCGIGFNGVIPFFMYGNLPHSVALVCHAWVGSQGHSEVHGQQCSAVVFQRVGSEGDELGCQIVVSVLTQGGDDGVPFLIEQRNVERHAVVESCGVAESLHVLPYGVVVVVADDGADIVLPAGVKGVSQACPPLFLLVVHGVGSDRGLEIAFGSEGTFDAPSGVFRKVGIIDYRRLADSVHETVETPRLPRIPLMPRAGI